MEIDCSIIVPIYNAEKTLLRTVSSVRKISGLEIEIILVDDGSTDSSLEIFEQQSKIDKRIVVCHQSNGGVSSARNHGISKAKGKYVYFIDADDTVFPETVKNMILAMDKYHLDMSISDYEEHNIILNQKKIISACLPYRQVLDRSYITKNIYRRFYLGDTIGLSNIWNKVFRYAVIKDCNIEFEVGRTHGEDWKFVIDYIFHANSLMVFPESVYSYFIDGSQVILKYRKGLLKSVLDSVRIKENIRLTGNFILSKPEEQRVLVEQFIGVINFLKLNPSKKELCILKRDRALRYLAKKMMFMPVSTLENNSMSRNLYLIAFFLYFGCISQAQQFINRYY